MISLSVFACLFDRDKRIPPHVRAVRSHTTQMITIGTSKVYLGLGFPLVIPQDSIRCVGWNVLMTIVFVLFLRVSPDSFRSAEDPLWIGFLVLYVLNYVLSIRTVFTDPGMVPPVLRNEEDDGSGVQAPNPLVEAADPSYMSDMFSLQYCRTCKHLRPKNASHCKLCDVCVGNFDHHCIVLGCCIGERNVGSFIAYLFSVSITAFYGTGLVVLSFYGLWKMDENTISMMNPVLYTYLGIFLCGGFTAVSVGFFAVYYLFLVLNGKTSKQYLTTSGNASFGVLALLKSLFSPKPSLLYEYEDWLDGQQNEESKLSG